MAPEIPDRLARVRAWADQRAAQLVLEDALRARRLPYELLTRAEIEILNREQRGAWPGCGRTDRRLRVDCDHATRLIRGLLCHRCALIAASLEAPERPAIEAYLARSGRPGAGRCRGHK